MMRADDLVDNELRDFWKDDDHQRAQDRAADRARSERGVAAEIAEDAENRFHFSGASTVARFACGARGSVLSLSFEAASTGTSRVCDLSNETRKANLIFEKT